MIRRSLFTSEFVSEGHPDKLADQIPGAILNAFQGGDHFVRKVRDAETPRLAAVLLTRDTLTEEPPPRLPEDRNGARVFLVPR